MNILITGAKGFVGQNLIAALESIKDAKDCVHKINALPTPEALNICKYDIDSPSEALEAYCKNADFVFNLAGVNRPKDSEEYMDGNFGFASRLLDTLKKHNNKAPVMLSSSIQASLEGRFAGSAYGKSKLAGEQLFADYGRETGVRVLIYRFPNLFGKWRVPIIILPWPPSATTLPTTCPSRSMTGKRCWSCSTLTILSRKCFLP